MQQMPLQDVISQPDPSKTEALKKSSSNADSTINFNLRSWQSSFHAWAALGEWPSIHLSRTITVHHYYQQSPHDGYFNSSEGTKKKKKRWLWFKYKFIISHVDIQVSMSGTHWVSDQVHIYQEQSRYIIIISNRLLMVIFTLQTRKEKKRKKRGDSDSTNAVSAVGLYFYIYIYYKYLNTI